MGQKNALFYAWFTNISCAMDCKTQKQENLMEPFHSFYTIAFTSGPM